MSISFAVIEINVDRWSLREGLNVRLFVPIVLERYWTNDRLRNSILNRRRECVEGMINHSVCYKNIGKKSSSSVDERVRGGE